MLAGVCKYIVSAYSGLLVRDSLDVQVVRIIILLPIHENVWSFLSHNPYLD
jgi:hypothetical protein